MEINETVILSGAITGIITGVVSGLISWLSNRPTRERVKTLEEKRVAGIETELQKHIEADKSEALNQSVNGLMESCDRLDKQLEKHTDADQTQALLSKTETVIDQNNEIFKRLNKIDRETGEQGATIREIGNHLDAFHADYSRHKRDGHGGK